MNDTLPIPVCVISEYRYELPASLEKSLTETLCAFKASYGQNVILHHGCTNPADVTARIFAHKASWRVENHPAGPVSGTSSRWPTPTRLQPEVVHPVLPYRDRDQEMILASAIIVAVEADWGGTGALVREEAAAGWEVRYVTPAGTIPVPRQPVRLSPTAWLVDEDHH